MADAFTKAFRAGKTRVVFPRSFVLEDGLAYKEGDGQHQHIVFDLGGGRKGNPAMLHPRTVCDMPFPADNLVSQHSEENQDQIDYPRCEGCFGP